MASEITVEGRYIRVKMVIVVSGGVGQEANIGEVGTLDSVSIIPPSDTSKYSWDVSEDDGVGIVGRAGATGKSAWPIWGLSRKSNNFNITGDNGTYTVVLRIRRGL